MRQAMKAPLEPGVPDIEQIEFDPKSRGRIPKLLRGLQMTQRE